MRLISKAYTLPYLLIHCVCLTFKFNNYCVYKIWQCTCFCVICFVKKTNLCISTSLQGHQASYTADNTDVHCMLLLQKPNFSCISKFSVEDFCPLDIPGRYWVYTTEKNVFKRLFIFTVQGFQQVCQVKGGVYRYCSVHFASNLWDQVYVGTHVWIH